jgi:hypothetical protein
VGDLDGRSCPRSSRFLTALLIGREELKETGTEPVLLIAARILTILRCCEQYRNQQLESKGTIQGNLERVQLHCSNDPKKTMLLILDASAEEELVRLAALSAISKVQCPQSIEDKR